MVFATQKLLNLVDDVVNGFRLMPLFLLNDVRELDGWIIVANDLRTLHSMCGMDPTVRIIVGSIRANHNLKRIVGFRIINDVSFAVFGRSTTYENRTKNCFLRSAHIGGSKREGSKKARPSLANQLIKIIFE
ncbi:hypothetical protein D3C86_1587640 [compost metagenome]